MLLGTATRPGLWQKAQAQGGQLELWHQELLIQPLVNIPTASIQSGPVSGLEEGCSFLTDPLLSIRPLFIQFPVQQSMWKSDHDTQLLKTF